ncbi:DUF4350 domain-containing protein [Micromonospora sp. LOL_021]|uniref:DUF4350 domain-containing protein n=1 Tax=Micromonospora sp. LOL_021 TaxID=3345417 RepID=UPI003A893155
MTRPGARHQGLLPQRWLRIAVPFTVVGVLIVGTAVAYQLTHPDPTRPGFLSPTNHGPEGGSDLAAALRGDGIAVHSADGTVDAIRAALTGPTTLFVPAPTLVHPDYLRALGRMPAGTRVLLVDPPARLLRGEPLPVERRTRRWAARVDGPDHDGRPCALPEVAGTGPAAAVRQRYAAPPGIDPDRFDLCFDAGLARLDWGQAELVVVGASDPFRNDRFDEHRNARFAAELLGTRAQVVWLDLARPDTPPEPGEPVQQPSIHLGEDDPGAGPQVSARPTGQPQGPVASDVRPPQDTLLDAFPPWFWALLAQLAAAALVLVLWRARRFGPPVTEALPVTVPVAETMLGRGQLYRRSRDRAPTAGILRTAALARLVPLLDLPDQPQPADVVAAVAARTEASAEQIDALLYGPPPTTDGDLLHLARRLAVLPAEVAGPANRVEPSGSPDRSLSAGPDGPPPDGPAGPVAPAPRSPSAIEGEPW